MVELVLPLNRRNEKWNQRYRSRIFKLRTLITEAYLDDSPANSGVLPQACITSGSQSEGNLGFHLVSLSSLLL